MFVSYNLVGSNSLSIREVLILNHLLMYMELKVYIELVSLFRVLLLMNLMAVNFILHMMVSQKGILLENITSPLMVMFFGLNNLFGDCYIVS